MAAATHMQAAVTATAAATTAATSTQSPSPATNSNTSACYDRKIAHVRDIFANFNSSSSPDTHQSYSSSTTGSTNVTRYRNNDDSYDFATNGNGSGTSGNNTSPSRSRQHKYKTLERHLSMKKTIRKKMMRDLREIGDATDQAPDTFLDKLKSDLPPTPNIDKPSFWKRLTKSWTSSGS